MLKLTRKNRRGYLFDIYVAAGQIASMTDALYGGTAITFSGGGRVFVAETTEQIHAELNRFNYDGVSRG